MKKTYCMRFAAALLTATTLCLPSLADDKDAPKKEEGKPNEADMMAMMMQMAQPGDNHKLLAEGAGSWNYVVKFWMSPDSAPMESTGKTVARSVMGGRYVITDHTGKMQMPGADGKMT